jgi:hypothetical protein
VIFFFIIYGEQFLQETGGFLDTHKTESMLLYGRGQRHFENLIKKKKRATKKQVFMENTG